ncbi:MAG: hypothetical protein UY71_C0006G0012 [Parcubacteria group bacterium GW2011_GWB1_52_7]|nr:MAG: hypothetical protein UY71_C0006G0012 [Parcubacteria group bacterium GW2011_GWB1_52_7]KKW31760.1 MAG: hypothetical protein UY75_C0001G0015 [Parcubacteria group bacterium GW2011_GWC2_52_8c]
MNEYKLERSLKAFANRRRVAIIQYLKRNAEASVREIAGAIRLSVKATSKHLGVLSAAEIVTRDQRSLQMFYRLTARPSPIPKSLIRLL